MEYVPDGQKEINAKGARMIAGIPTSFAEPETVSFSPRDEKRALAASESHTEGIRREDGT